MSVYNCKHEGGRYRVTKFDEELNLLESYLCTETECECPAGQRETCRHRQMLPKFLARRQVGSGALYDYELDNWWDFSGAGNSIHRGRPTKEVVMVRRNNKDRGRVRDYDSREFINMMLDDEPWPLTVQYWGDIAHYIPPDRYVWRSWEPGPSDCTWIVPGTAERHM